MESEKTNINPPNEDDFTSNTAAAALAADYSSRMRSVDKLQIEIDGKTLLKRCVGKVLRSCIERCILVIGGGYTGNRDMEMGMPDFPVKIVEVIV